MQVSDMRALRLIFYTKTRRLHRLNPSIPNSLSSFPQFSRHFLHSTTSLHHSNSTPETAPRAWSIYDPAPGTDTPKLPAPTVSNDSNGRDGNGNAKKPNLDIVGNKKKGKARFSWVCADCGHSDGQWWGTCRQCNAVGTLKRFSEGGSAEVSEGKTWLSPKAGESRPMRLTDVNRGINQLNWRIPLHGPFGNEVSRVLGGGIVPGSLVLVGGDPGVGKSTLLLQIAAMIAERNDLGQPAPVVYVSGEESVEQIGNRADRLSIGADELFLYSNTEIEDILGKSQPLSPRVIIVDSIQTVYLEGVAGSAGGPAQVKECTSALLRFAKKTNIPILLIGHVTKSGDLAGPHVLEHIVDVVLYMEGEKYSSYRLLRSLKNRFGSTDELGVFEMSQSGLQAVSNPSEMFLSDQYSDSEYLAGLAVAVIMDGSRTFLIEVQALCASGSIASRQVNGIQASRADMIISVLMKQTGLKLQENAIFLNVVSGVKLSETAGDLAVAAAICSSFLEFPIPNNIAFIGEVGLGGELRTKEKTGHSPSRIELFDITHVQANGQAVNKPTQDALVALRNLTTQVNEEALQISQDQMFVEVFGPERHGRVRGYGARVTPTKLRGSSSSRMYDLEKRLQESAQKRLESENKRIEADVELKEEVKNLKSMLEQQAIQMAEQRRHFEEQQANQMAKQRAHYDNMMMQMLSCITSQSAQSSSDH